MLFRMKKLRIHMKCINEFDNSISEFQIHGFWWYFTIWRFVEFLVYSHNNRAKLFISTTIGLFYVCVPFKYELEKTLKSVNREIIWRVKSKIDWFRHQQRYFSSMNLHYLFNLSTFVVFYFFLPFIMKVEDEK